MHAIFSVFRKEFRENLRDRRTVISALIFGPLFGPLLFGATLSMSIEHGTAESDRIVTLAVSHAERAPNLVAYLQQYRVKVEQVSFDDAAARAAVKEHRRPMLLLIADDFGTRLSASEPAPLSLYVDSSYAANAKVVARIRNLLSQYGGLLARLRVLARGIDPLVLSPIVVRDIDVSTPASRSVLALGTLSYLVLLTMLMGGMYLAIDATAGERERGSLEPLLTVPVRREHLIYGKMLATCAYMTLSLSLTVTAFAIVLQFAGLERFGMSVNFGAGVALRIVVLCLPLVPLGAALMTIVAAFTRSYREAQTYLGLVLLVPTLPLVFAGVLGLRPSAPLMAIPSLSQHFLITSLLRDESLPASYVALSVGVTLAIAAVLVTIAGRLYRREALLG
ncbi:MAG TPA: ABC transporter permease [Steroidobacteraceae bacterium]|nr:ABC transporter permease [Steroidobacteraceae bacterium]